MTVCYLSRASVFLLRELYNNNDDELRVRALACCYYSNIDNNKLYDGFNESPLSPLQADGLVSQQIALVGKI